VFSISQGGPSKTLSTPKNTATVGQPSVDNPHTTSQPSFDNPQTTSQPSGDNPQTTSQPIRNREKRVSDLGSSVAGFFGRFLGSEGIAIMTTTCVSFSSILSVIAFYEVAPGASACYLRIAPWVSSEMFDAS
jgi:hypothetical protein